MGGRKLSDAKIIEIVDQKAVDELKSEAEKILNRLLTMILKIKEELRS